MAIKGLKTKLCLTAGACGVLFLAQPAVLQAQSPDSSAAAAMEIRFQQMEKEIRRLTGQIEEQSYEIRRLKAELAKVSGEVDVRLRDLESGSSSASGQPSNAGYTAKPSHFSGHSSVADKADAKKVMPKKDEGSFQYTPPKEAQSLGTLNKSAKTGQVSSVAGAAQAYEYAYSFIRARDFARAEGEFAKFMSDYPQDPLVSNAKYWYGETFYVRGNYEKAARIFAEGYQKFPKGPKAASNLLKLGMALSGMGKADDACVAYKQLKKEYSGSAVSLLKRAETEMKKINCR